MKRNIFLGWAAASVAMMVIGSLVTWARVDRIFGSGSDSFRGTDGDGWTLIGAGLIALGLIAYHERRKRGIGPLLIALLAALIASAAVIYDWADLHRVASDWPGLVHSGWGIYVATVGSVSLAAACVALIVTARAPQEIPAPTPEPGA